MIDQWKKLKEKKDKFELSDKINPEIKQEIVTKYEKLKETLLKQLNEEFGKLSNYS